MMSTQFTLMQQFEGSIQRQSHLSVGDGRVDRPHVKWDRSNGWDKMARYESAVCRVGIRSRGGTFDWRKSEHLYNVATIDKQNCRSQSCRLSLDSNVQSYIKSQFFLFVRTEDPSPRALHRQRLVCLPPPKVAKAPKDEESRREYPRHPKPSQATRGGW